MIMKIMSTQVDRDDRIQNLFTAMNSFYDIVSDLENEPEKRESLQDLLQRIAKQTTECFYFIRDYAKTEGFREPNLILCASLIKLFSLNSESNGTAPILRGRQQDQRILCCV